MRHVYECPMRWADLDLLGHVNNVVYVDYLQEARVDMLRTHASDSRAGELAEGVVVVRHEVEYVAPLAFDFRPVLIESWVTEIRAASFTIAYEVYRDDGSARRTFLRATTVLTPYVFVSERPRRLHAEERAALTAFLEPGEPLARTAAPAPRRGPLGHYPVRVRFSDVDVYGHVNNVTYFEYFQEARIQLLHRLAQGLPGAADLRTVVARTDVDYRVPILFRPEPYDAWCSVSRVGRTSVVIDSEICDGDQVLSRCRVVMVFVDPATERATAPPPAFRDRLVAAAG